MSFNLFSFRTFSITNSLNCFYCQIRHVFSTQSVLHIMHKYTKLIHWPFKLLLLCEHSFQHILWHWCQSVFHILKKDSYVFIILPNHFYFLLHSIHLFKQPFFKLFIYFLWFYRTFFPFMIVLNPFSLISEAKTPEILKF